MSDQHSQRGQNLGEAPQPSVIPPEDYVNQGILLMTKLQYTQALFILEQGLAHHPKNPKLLCYTGICFGYMGEHHKGLDRLCQSLSANLEADRCPLALTAIAQTIWNMGHRIAAYGILSDTLSAYPSFAEGYRTMGLFMLGDGNDDVGVRHIMHSLQLDPELHIACMDMARYYFHKEDFANALPLLSTFLQHHQQNTEALFYQGHCLLKLGHSNGGIKALRAALQFSSDESATFPTPMDVVHALCYALNYVEQFAEVLQITEQHLMLASNEEAPKLKENKKVEVGSTARLAPPNTTGVDTFPNAMLRIHRLYALYSLGRKEEAQRQRPLITRGMSTSDMYDYLHDLYGKGPYRPKCRLPKTKKMKIEFLPND